MESSIVAAVFRGRMETEVPAIWQYSYGIRLVLSDLVLPDSYEVQFGETRTAATVTFIGGADGVEIPAALLDTPGTKYAWLFVHDGENDGYTKNVVRIPVSERGAITDAQPTPIEQGVITQTIAALQAAVGRAEEIEEAMPGEIADALSAAKESGEFDGADGVTFTPAVSEEGVISWTNDGGRENPESVDIKGPKGDPGQDGEDGVSPTVEVTDITGGHEVRVTDAEGTKTFYVMDGAPGTPGAKGDDGFSPAAAVTQTEDGAEISVTDRTGTTTAEVKNGKDGAPGDPGPAGPGVASGGTTGQMLVKKSGTDYDTEWQDKPTSPVQDVQVNGTSVLNDGIANVPVASSSAPGVVMVDQSYGIIIHPTLGYLAVNQATANDIKAGTVGQKPIVPYTQDASAFYGLARAAGDSTQSSSDNAVGTYTESAKSAISQMLNAPVTVSGTTPSITAKAGVQYVCGEVATLTIVVPASGCIDVIFESGSTPTVLTVTPPTGMTMKWPDLFNPTALKANTTYEINILNGNKGVVMEWT